MTGSRDLEGMVVFSVGRVMNAWVVEEALFAFEQAYIYYWYDEPEEKKFLNMIGYL